MAVAEKGRNVEFIGLGGLRMRGADAGEKMGLWRGLRGSVHDGATTLATFAARTTPEWDTWFAKNQKAFGQVEFAEFLEDN